MANPNADPPKHGSHKRPKCIVCGRFMKLKRREAHPIRGPKYELQTYDCPGCGNSVGVNVATPGAG
jgi:uncharacterized protein YlaI